MDGHGLEVVSASTCLIIASSMAVDQEDVVDVSANAATLTAGSRYFAALHGAS